MEMSEDSKYPKVYTVFWTTSKAENSYGWSLVTARDWRGEKVASTCGGGYDMTGTVLADILKVAFPDRVKALAAKVPKADEVVESWSDASELRHAVYVNKDGEVFLEGGTGIRTMQNIARKHMDVMVYKAEPGKGVSVLTLIDVRPGEWVERGS